MKTKSKNFKSIKIRSGINLEKAKKEQAYKIQTCNVINDYCEEHCLDEEELEL